MTFLLATALLQAPPDEIKIVQRKAVPYLSMRATVDGPGLGRIFPTLMPKLDSWMKEHHVQPRGPVFFRYIYVDMPKRLDVEVGTITHTRVKASGDVISSEIPAGKYVSLTHFGDYAGLIPPNGKLQDFARSKHLEFKMRKGKNGDEFVGRFELYETDPDKEPDKNKWETNILYMVK